MHRLAVQAKGDIVPNYKTTLWSESEPPVSFLALRGDLTVDVAIVGAGITGITAAYLLKQAGLRVAVLESRRLGSGETYRTTAHLTEVLDLRFHRLISKFGLEGARLAVRGQRFAIDSIERLARELGLEGQPERRIGYLYAETDAEAEELEAEEAAARKVGLAPRRVSETPLPFSVKGALSFADQAQINPRAYLQALAARVDHGGSRVFEVTHVEEITDGEPCRVVTRNGVVTARDVIVASGVPVSNRYLVLPKLAAYRSYAIAIARPSATLDGLFWDMKDPYHYVRTQTVRGVPYLIVGGEDHKVGEEDDTTQPFERLEAYAANRFGQPTAPTDFRWSGQIIESADGLPYVGRNALSKHLYVATGYSGNGMTGGTLAATIVADQVRGLANDWSALLDATRIKPLASAAAVVSENIDYPKHVLKDHLVPLPRKKELERIPPGGGAVLSVDGKKLAVYRNGEGQLSAVSPVCTHLGCFVHWNTAERSWDCPCHGSRFDPMGRVLNGPATTPLETKPLPTEAVETSKTA
jgi:glycine/D-amino acid oxidase-like deaminating enzyme/nitrite reductase/ring-hydroxylating ferredoxin subunit